MPKAFHRSLSLAVVSLSIGVAAVFVGCSGAETQDVLTTGASSGATTATTSGSNTSNSSGASGTTSGGTTSGTTGGTSGTTGGTGACATPESEPNDSAAQANLLAPTRCGTVGGGDSKDDLTFTLSAKAQTLKIIFHGNVQLRVFVGNRSPVTITPQEQQSVDVIRGATYLIEVTSLAGGGAATPWDVTVEQN